MANFHVYSYTSTPACRVRAGRQANFAPRRIAKKPSSSFFIAKHKFARTGVGSYDRPGGDLRLLPRSHRGVRPAGCTHPSDQDEGPWKPQTNVVKLAVSIASRGWPTRVGSGRRRRLFLQERTPEPLSGNNLMFCHRRWRIFRIAPSWRSEINRFEGENSLETKFAIS